MSETYPANDLPNSAGQMYEHAYRKLLYVEDQPANLALVVQLISRRTNWKLLTAIDGHLGMLLAKANRPDVILMDINLPGIDGFEVLRLLRADPDVCTIPVIALSSNAFPIDLEKGSKAGFFRYLTKPYRIGDLMSALDDALELVPQRQSSF
ncbi:MAG TPA: response regulator [Burkholderiaceae bacterium]|jgi:CheY-like chemotaxis protein